MIGSSLNNGHLKKPKTFVNFVMYLFVGSPCLWILHQESAMVSCFSGLARWPMQMTTNEPRGT